MRKQIIKTLAVCVVIGTAAQITTLTYANEVHTEQQIAEENDIDVQQSDASVDFIDETEKDNTDPDQQESTDISGWRIEDEGYYYYKEDGQKASGWMWIDDHWYYFAQDGKMQTGWLRLGKVWYYLDKTGIMRTGWVYIGNSYYYLGKDGVMLTGWRYIDNNYYYLNANGAMQTGWQKIAGKWYYLGGKYDGAMKTGWLKVNNIWYYLGGKYDGAMKTGWQMLGSNKYYFNADGSMQTGWQKMGKNWYYFGVKNDGAMKTGWQKVNNIWYYLGGTNDGVMKTGWLTLGGNKYYLNADGAMQTGWQYLGNKWYYFYKENDKYANAYGVMSKNTIIEGYRILSNGVMSNYYRMQTKISLPSGGYSLSTQNIGLKVIKVNERLFEKTNARYTTATENAVRAFQRNHGLTVTGVVDLTTWKAMGLTEDDWYNLGTYCTPMKVNYDSSRQACINAMLQTAEEYRKAGTKYLEGCSGNPGTYVDCSGLIYQCLYSAGINPDTNIVMHAQAKYEYTSAYLARDTKLGYEVSYNNLQSGDLVFYNKGNKNSVVHVGIYAGNNQIYDSWPGLGVTKRNITISGYRVSKVIRVF